MDQAQTLATKSETEQLLASVLDYKNPEVVGRFMRVLNLSQRDADLLFEDVKKYLFLVVVSGERLTPTLFIDLGWHEFLLYTRDYAGFCNRFFGKFIHHTPNPHLTPHVATTAGRTVELARATFGDLSANWSRRTIDSKMSGDCQAECAPDADCHGDGSCGGDV